MPTLIVTERELTTILVALRYWQNDWMEQSEFQPWREYFYHDTPLDGEEIGKLCENLNCHITS